MEDVPHTLWDCPLARQFWVGLLPMNRRAGFFASSVTLWLQENLGSKEVGVGGVPWCIIFALGYWYLWIWRCNRIFRESAAISGNQGNICCREQVMTLRLDRSMRKGGAICVWRRTQGRSGSYLGPQCTSSGFPKPSHGLSIFDLRATRLHSSTCLL